MMLIYYTAITSNAITPNNITPNGISIDGITVWYRYYSIMHTTQASKF